MAPKLQFKISPREFIFAFFIILLPFSLFAEKKLGLTIIGYSDETLCIICILYILYFSFKKGIKGIDLTMLILLIVCSVITLCGNLINKLITNWFPIIVDLVCLAKIFTVFIVYKLVGERDTKKRVISYLVPICKITIILGSIFGILSQFVNLGMTTPNRRYGILPYYFIFENEGRYGYIIACAFLILLLAKLPKKQERIYEVLMIFNIIITTKGVTYIIVISYIVLVIMWKKTLKLNAKTLILLILSGFAASSVQINTYLRDTESPRVTLIRYGFKTANTYFPFGSGFATYGSDMAARNYSKLYIKYGFENRYGLSTLNSTCLNDCYLGMVVGQFGYIGMIVFLVMLCLIFVPLDKIAINKRVKALTVSIFIGLLVSCIGTAIIKSSIGVFSMAVIGLICGYSQQYNSILEAKKAEKGDNN
jgi:hypothetical protein